MAMHMLDAAVTASQWPHEPSIDLSDQEGTDIRKRIVDAVTQGIADRDVSREPHLVLMSPTFYDNALRNICGRWAVVYLINNADIRSMLGLPNAENAVVEVDRPVQADADKAKTAKEKKQTASDKLRKRVKKLAMEISLNKAIQASQTKRELEKQKEKQMRAALHAFVTKDPGADRVWTGQDTEAKANSPDATCTDATGKKDDRPDIEVYLDAAIAARIMGEEHASALERHLDDCIAGKVDGAKEHIVMATKLVNLARDWVCSYLPHCLGKRNRVDYGLISQSDILGWQKASSGGVGGGGDKGVSIPPLKSEYSGSNTEQIVAAPSGVFEASVSFGTDGDDDQMFGIVRSNIWDNEEQDYSIIKNIGWSIQQGNTHVHRAGGAILQVEPAEPWQLKGTTVTMRYDTNARTLSFWPGRSAQGDPKTVIAEVPSDEPLSLALGLYQNTATVDRLVQIGASAAGDDEGGGGEEMSEHDTFEADRWNPKSRKLLAIPFSGKDAPSAKSEFSSPEILIGLTFLAYRYSGLRQFDLYRLLSRLMQTMKTEAGPFADRPSHRRFANWIKQADDQRTARAQREGDSTDDVEVLSLDLFQPNDQKQMHSAHQALSLLGAASIEYMQALVFPQVMSHQSLKMQASGMDLGSDMLFGTRLGFSGTPSDLMPYSLGSVGVQPGTDAKVLRVLTSSNFVTIPSGDLAIADEWSVESILEQIAASTKPEFHAMVDAGALITGFSNVGTARYLLQRLRPEIKGCAFLDSANRTQILMREENRVMPLAECGLGPEERFSFYDQIHSTGTDIKQCSQASCALTLGKGMTLRDLAQGAWRMRGLTLGQTITLVIVPEVQKQIDSTGSTQQDAGMEARLRKVVEWLLDNSASSEQKQNLQLLGQQASNLYRSRAFDELIDSNVPAPPVSKWSVLAKVTDESSDDTRLSPKFSAEEAVEIPHCTECNGAMRWVEVAHAASDGEYTQDDISKRVDHYRRSENTGFDEFGCQHCFHTGTGYRWHCYTCMKDLCKDCCERYEVAPVPVNLPSVVTPSDPLFASRFFGGENRGLSKQQAIRASSFMQSNDTSALLSKPTGEKFQALRSYKAPGLDKPIPMPAQPPPKKPATQASKEDEKKSATDVEDALDRLALTVEFLPAFMHIKESFWEVFRKLCAKLQESDEFEFELKQKVVDELELTMFGECLPSIYVPPKFLMDKTQREQWMDTCKKFHNASTMQLRAGCVRVAIVGLLTSDANMFCASKLSFAEACESGDGRVMIHCWGEAHNDEPLVSICTTGTSGKFLHLEDSKASEKGGNKDVVVGSIVRIIPDRYQKAVDNGDIQISQSWLKPGEVQEVVAVDNSTVPLNIKHHGEDHWYKREDMELVGHKIWVDRRTSDCEKVAVKCNDDGTISLRGTFAGAKYLGKGESDVWAADCDEGKAARFRLLDLPRELKDTTSQVQVLSPIIQADCLVAKPGLQLSREMVESGDSTAERASNISQAGAEPPSKFLMVPTTVNSDVRYRSDPVDGDDCTNLLSESGGFTCSASTGLWCVLDMGEPRQFSRVSLRATDGTDSAKTVKLQCASRSVATDSLKGPWEAAEGSNALWEVEFTCQKVRDMQHFEFPKELTEEDGTLKHAGEDGTSPQKRWWRVQVIGNHGDPERVTLGQVSLGGLPKYCSDKALANDASSSDVYVVATDLFDSLEARTGGRGVVQFDDFMIWWQSTTVAMFGVAELKDCISAEVIEGARRAWKRLECRDLVPCSRKDDSQVAASVVGRWDGDPLHPLIFMGCKIERMVIREDGKVDFYKKDFDPEGGSALKKRHDEKRCLEPFLTSVSAVGMGCDGCKLKIIPGSRTHGCRKCDHHLCSGCHKTHLVKLAELNVEQAKHKAKLCLERLATKDDTSWCTECRSQKLKKDPKSEEKDIEKLKKGTPMFGCRKCDQNLCVSCHDALQVTQQQESEENEKNKVLATATPTPRAAQWDQEKGVWLDMHSDMAEPQPEVAGAGDISQWLSWSKNWTATTKPNSDDEEKELWAITTVEGVDDVAELDCGESGGVGIVVASQPFPSTGRHTCFVKLTNCSGAAAVGLVESFTELTKMEDDKKTEFCWIGASKRAWALYSDGDCISGAKWGTPQGAVTEMRQRSGSDGCIVGMTFDATKMNDKGEPIYSVSVECNEVYLHRVYDELPKEVYLAVGIDGKGTVQVMPPGTCESNAEWSKIETGALQCMFVDQDRAFEVRSMVSGLSGLWSVERDGCSLQFSGVDGTCAMMHLCDKDLKKSRERTEMVYPEDDRNTHDPFTAAIVGKFYEGLGIAQEEGAIDTIVTEWNELGVRETQAKCKEKYGDENFPKPQEIKELKSGVHVFLRKGMRSKQNWNENDVAICNYGPDSDQEYTVDRVADGENRRYFVSADMVRAVPKALPEGVLKLITCRHFDMSKPVPKEPRLEEDEYVMLRPDIMELKGLRPGELATVKGVQVLVSDGRDGELVRYTIQRVFGDKTILLYFAPEELVLPVPSDGEPDAATLVAPNRVMTQGYVTGIVDQVDFHHFLVALARCQPRLQRLIQTSREAPQISRISEGMYFARELYRNGLWASKFRMDGSGMADSSVHQPVPSHPHALVLQHKESWLCVVCEDRGEEGDVYICGLEDPGPCCHYRLQCEYQVCATCRNKAWRTDCIKVFEEVLEYDIAGTVKPPATFDIALENERIKNHKVMDGSARWWTPRDSQAAAVAAIKDNGSPKAKRLERARASDVYNEIVSEAQWIVRESARKGGGGLMLDAEMVQEQEQEKEEEREEEEAKLWRVNHGKRSDQPRPWDLKLLIPGGDVEGTNEREEAQDMKKMKKKKRKMKEKAKEKGKQKEKKEASLEVPKCPTAGHQMVWSDSNKGGYANGWSCNECSSSRADHEDDDHGFRWFCEKCSDDLCSTCKPAPNVSGDSMSPVPRGKRDPTAHVFMPLSKLKLQAGDTGTDENKDSKNLRSINFPKHICFSDQFAEERYSGDSWRRLGSVLVVLNWARAEDTLDVAVTLAEAQTLRRCVQENLLPPKAGVSLHTADGMDITYTKPVGTLTDAPTTPGPDKLALALLCFRFFNNGTYYTRNEQFRLVQLLSTTKNKERLEFFEGAVKCRRKAPDDKGQAIGRALRMFVRNDSAASLRSMFDVLDQIQDELGRNSARVRSKFTELDTDTSGSLDEAEMEQLFVGANPLAANVTPQQMSDVFRFVDESNDGLISFSEFSEAFKPSPEALIGGLDLGLIATIADKRRQQQMQRVLGNGFATFTSGKQVDGASGALDDSNNSEDEALLRASLADLSLAQLRAEALGANISLEQLDASYDTNSPIAAVAQLLVDAAKAKRERRLELNLGKQWLLRYRELLSMPMSSLRQIASKVIDEHEVEEVFQQADPKTALAQSVLSSERHTFATMQKSNTESMQEYAKHLVLKDLRYLGQLVHIQGEACVLGTDNSISTAAGTCATVGAKGVVLTQGNWYYEAEVVAGVPGACRAVVGFCDVMYTCVVGHGDSLGRDRDGHSWGLGGHSRLGGRLYKGAVMPPTDTFSFDAWEVGDVIGCGIEIDSGRATIHFWRNGDHAGVAFSHDEISQDHNGNAFSPAASVEFGAMLKINLGESMFRFGLPERFQAIHNWVLQRAVNVRWTDAGKDAGRWIAGSNAKFVTVADDRSTESLPGTVAAHPSIDGASSSFDFHIPGVGIGAGRWYYEVTVAKGTSDQTGERELSVGWAEHLYGQTHKLSGQETNLGKVNTDCALYFSNQNPRQLCQHIGNTGTHDTGLVNSLEDQFDKQFEKLAEGDTIGCLIDMQHEPFTVAYRVMREVLGETKVMFPHDDAQESSEAFKAATKDYTGFGALFKLGSLPNAAPRMWKPAVAAVGYDLNLNVGPKFLSDTLADALPVSEWLDKRDRLPPSMLSSLCAQVATSKYVLSSSDELALVPSTGVRHITLQDDVRFKGETNAAFVVESAPSSQLPSVRARLPGGSLLSAGKWYYEVKILRLHAPQLHKMVDDDGSEEEEEEESFNPSRPEFLPNRLVLGWCDESFFGDSAARIGLGTDRHGWGIAFDNGDRGATETGGVHLRDLMRTSTDTSGVEDYAKELTEETDVKQWDEDKSKYLKGDRVSLEVDEDDAIAIKKQIDDAQANDPRASAGMSPGAVAGGSTAASRTVASASPKAKDSTASRKMTGTVLEIYQQEDGPDLCDVAILKPGVTYTVTKVAPEKVRRRFKDGDAVKYKNVHDKHYCPNDAYSIGYVQKWEEDERTYSICPQQADLEKKNAGKAIPRRFVADKDFDEFMLQGGEVHWPYQGKGSAWAVNDIIGCALNMDDGSMDFTHNGKKIHRNRSWEYDILYGTLAGKHATKAEKEEWKQKKASWLESGWKRGADRPLFTGVKPMFGVQPCMSLGPGMKVAVSFGPRGFAKSSRPPDYSWLSEWTATTGSTRAVHKSRKEGGMGSDADETARQHLTNKNVPPEERPKLLEFLARQSSRHVSLAHISRSSPFVERRLRAIWMPDSEWSTIDISGLPVAGGETLHQEFEALLLVLQAAFDDPWTKSVAEPKAQTSDAVRCSMGRPVTVFKANDCKLEQERADSAVWSGFGAFVATAVTGYERSVVRIPPIQLFRPELLELQLRGNKLRGEDIEVLCKHAVVCTSLERLDLGENDFGQGGARVLRKLLVKLPSLRHLNVTESKVSRPTSHPNTF